MKGPSGMRAKGAAPKPQAPARAHSALPAGHEAAIAPQAAERDELELAELYRLVGSIETACFIETVSSKVVAQHYLRARDLLGKVGSVLVRTRSGEAKHVSRMDEFCEAVMPYSVRRCQQIVSAMESLGEELFEQAERMGFRARDYQALKALPADDQVLVKFAIEGGARDQALDLLAVLADRNQALRKKNEDTEKTLAAVRKVARERSDKLDRIEEEKAAEDHLDAVEQSRRAHREIGEAAVPAINALNRLVATAARVIKRTGFASTDLYARNSVAHVMHVFVEACLSAGISTDPSEHSVPDWAQRLEQLAVARPAAADSRQTQA